MIANEKRKVIILSRLMEIEVHDANTNSFKLVEGRRIFKGHYLGDHSRYYGMGDGEVVSGVEIEGKVCYYSPRQLTFVEEWPKEEYQYTGRTLEPKKSLWTRIFG